MNWIYFWASIAQILLAAFFALDGINWSGMFSFVTKPFYGLSIFILPALSLYWQTLIASLIFSDICIRGKKSFAHELSLFTEATLKRHIKSGDPADLSFRGHPKCEFCALHLYSEDELYEHLREKHHACEICKRLGVKDQYYKDYDQLSAHFNHEHYPCRHPTCMELKFVVFNSALDLQLHSAETHSSSLPKNQRRQARTLDLEINYANDYSNRQNRQQRRPSPTSQQVSHSQSSQKHSHEPTSSARRSNSSDPASVSSSMASLQLFSNAIPTSGCATHSNLAVDSVALASDILPSKTEIFSRLTQISSTSSSLNDSPSPPPDFSRSSVAAPPSSTNADFIFDHGSDDPVMTDAQNNLTSTNDPDILRFHSAAFD